jgi:hypothetical protein
VDIAFKNDATVLCIGHREGSAVVVDVWRAWKPGRGRPLSLEDMSAEIALVCKSFQVGLVYGDQYCAEPVREAFQRHGLTFSEVTFTSRRWKRHTPDERREIGASKVDIFNVLKTLLLQTRLDLPDVPEGVKQLKNLEVRRSRFSTTEQIGAPEGQHDDYPSALALVCWVAWRADELTATPLEVRRTGPLLLDQELIGADPWDEELPEGAEPLMTGGIREPGSGLGVGMRWLRGH